MIEQALIKAAEALGDELKNSYIVLRCEVMSASDAGVRSAPRVVWQSYANGGNHQTGATLAEAMDKTRAEMDPNHIANRLRREAAELLARAEALDLK